MAETSGAGRVIRDLGLIDRFDDDIAGVIGGRGQPSTLLVVFRTSSPFSIEVRRRGLQPFTDRFIAVGLRWRDGGVIPLDDQGRPVPPNDLAIDDRGQGRLPPGEYAVSIATSQWQEAPFRLRLTLVALGSLRITMTGRGRLAAGFRITRLATALQGHGVLVPYPGQRCALAWTGTQRGRLWCGLTSTPTYRPVGRPGLPHAWLIWDDKELSVGSGDGSTWLVTPWPPLGDYIPSTLSIPDYRAGTRRLVFAAGSDAVYATYPDIGPTPGEVTSARSPDAPDRPFQDVIQGTYRRHCAFSLPVDGATQLVVIVQEELRWNNDVIRDVVDVGQALSSYSARNARAASIHQRTVWVFTVTASQVRRLRQVPAGLRIRLEDILPPLTSTLQPRRLQVPGDRYTPAFVECLVPGFAVTGTVPSEGDRILGGDPAEPYGNLLISFGLTMALQAHQGFTSAAVYDFLFNADAIFAEPDYDRRSYAFAIRVLENRPDGLIQYCPWTQDGGYAVDGTEEGAYLAPGALRLLYGTWSGPFPADAAAQLPLTGEAWRLSSLGQDLRPERANRYPRLQGFVAYDWGQPNYCRAQLGALGFVSADLLGQATGWRELINLNPTGGRLLVGAGGLRGSRLTSQGTRRLRLALSATGRLAASKLSGDDLKILRGRGRLVMKLGALRSGGYVPLTARLGGRGRLPGSLRLASLRGRLRAEGSLGRPRLSTPRTPR